MDTGKERASESLINTIFQKVQMSELLRLRIPTKQGRTIIQLFALLEIVLKNVKRNYTGSFPMGFLKIPELGKLWRFKIYIKRCISVIHRFLMPID